MANLQKGRRALGRLFTEPIVKVLKKTGITPNALTWIGVLISCGAGALAGTNHLFAAGWVAAFAGIFDLFDGALARATDKASNFGAILDSSLDRVGEAAVMIGLMVYYVNQVSVAGIIVVGLALVGSQMVSYIRSRAETFGVDCEVGILTRPERVIIISLGLVLSGIGSILFIALGVIALLSWVTAGQRLYHVWKKTKAD